MSHDEPRIPVPEAADVKWLLSFSAAAKVIGMDDEALRTASRRKNDPLPTFHPPGATFPKVNMLLVPAWLERNSIVGAR